MKTNTSQLATHTHEMPLDSTILPKNITAELENIMLKMIYRISKENQNVPDHVGNAA